MGKKRAVTKDEEDTLKFMYAGGGSAYVTKKGQEDGDYESLLANGWVTKAVKPWGTGTAPYLTITEAGMEAIGGVEKLWEEI